MGERCAAAAAAGYVTCIVLYKTEAAGRLLYCIVLIEKKKLCVEDARK